MIDHLAHLLLRLTVEFSLVLAVLLLLRLWLRRAYGAACAYLSWALVPLLLAVAQLPTSRPAHLVQVLVANELPPGAALPASLIPETADWSLSLLTAWFIGMLACLLVLGLQQRRFMRGLKRHADRTHWLGPAGSGPALIGFWRPLVCLPADFEQRFSHEQQRLILAHEEVHRLRRDNLWNLLAALIVALQWFNPLAWLGLRLMRVDQELSCDAAVLRESAQVTDYAHALLNAQPDAALAGSLHASWRSAHPLVERISMLKLHATARRHAGLRMLALLGLLGAGAVHALQTEPAAPVTSGPADVRLDLEVDYTEPSTNSYWTLKTRVDAHNGQPVTLGMPLQRGGEATQTMEIAIRAKPNDKGQWWIDTVLRKGDLQVGPVANPGTLQVDGGPGGSVHMDPKTIAKPRLLIENAQTGRIESTGTDGHTIRLVVRPTSLHPREMGSL
ncbi:MAG TPA: M56 family metallopeptidase [Burkholderiaceae bacterium]|jgi:beta-lactamase regulating signal transducer with metallopeptidase domain